MTFPTPRTRASALLLPLLLLACGDGPAAPEFQVIEEVTFAANLEIDLAAMTRTASGMYFEDLVVGDGDLAGVGNQADVAYAGWLTSGAQFDSGRFGFEVGAGDVIPGFDEGVAGMRVGGVRILIIPPALAYGARAVGAIPPGAILVFRVELLELT